MKPILTPLQIKSNPNFACNISAQIQDELRLGNCLMIADICGELNLRENTMAVAMLYTNLFFVTRTYLEYERGLVCCAAILISSKALYEKVRINDLCVQYWQSRHKGKICPPINDEQKKRIVDQMFKAECAILRCVDFKLDFDCIIPWQEYTGRYISQLYEPLIKQGQSNTLWTLAKAICSDCFMTYIPLMYPLQTIALAAIMMAAAKYKHPLPSAHESFNYDETFKVHQRRHPNAERAVFDQQHWAHKIDERIGETDLFEIIRTMNAFYSRVAQEDLFNSINSKQL